MPTPATSTGDRTAHTLLLTREDVRQALPLKDCTEAVQDAFARHFNGETQVPDVVHMTAEGGAIHVKSAALVGKPAWVAVKINANFPDNARLNGLPTIQGVIALLDGSNGRPLAVIDSAEVTAIRTAAASAVAIRCLARPAARTAAIFGCGIQGRQHAEVLANLDSLKRLYLHDAHPERREQLAVELRTWNRFEVETIDGPGQATRNCDIIVTCTSSREPFLARDHVSPGTLVVAVGADNDDKQELQAELLAESKVVVDVLEQCSRMGELHHAIDAGLMQAVDVHANLGAIVCEAATVPDPRHHITVFDSTGSAFQDVAAARMVYERATALNLGARIVF